MARFPGVPLADSSPGIPGPRGPSRGHTFPIFSNLGFAAAPRNTYQNRGPRHQPAHSDLSGQFTAGLPGVPVSAELEFYKMEGEGQEVRGQRRRKVVRANKVSETLR